MKFFLIFDESSVNSDLFRALSCREYFAINVFAANILFPDVNMFASIISSPLCSSIFASLKKRPGESSAFMNISMRLSNFFLHPR